MLEKIHVHPIKDHYGNCYGTTIPDNIELMEKINELIDVVNELQKNKITKPKEL